MNVYDIETMADIIPEVKLVYRRFFIIAAIAAVPAIILFVSAALTSTWGLALAGGLLIAIAAAYIAAGIMVKVLYKAFNEDDDD